MEMVEFADLKVNDRFKMTKSTDMIVYDVLVVEAPHTYDGQMLRVKIAFEDGSIGFVYGFSTNDLRKRS